MTQEGGFIESESEAKQIGRDMAKKASKKLHLKLKPQQPEQVNDKFDGNYHCSKCDYVFRIADQAEFLEHQADCQGVKPEQEDMPNQAPKADPVDRSEKVTEITALIREWLDKPFDMTWDKGSVKYIPDLSKSILALFNPNEIRRQDQMALSVIEGSLIIDEPTDKRLSFIYRMAHVGMGECEHEEWAEEMENCYQQLVKDNIV